MRNPNHSFPKMSSLNGSISNTMNKFSIRLYKLISEGKCMQKNIKFLWINGRYNHSVEVI